MTARASPVRQNDSGMLPKMNWLKDTWPSSVMRVASRMEEPMRTKSRNVT
ncbi:MAG: hypothetical protein ABIE42_09480 [Candidatus Eisenbacteria bacterium]